MTKWLFLLFFTFNFLAAEPNALPPYKKLPIEIECPFDDWMVDISVPYFDAWRSVGTTANTLTLLGGFFQLLSCYFLAKRFGLLAGALWLFGYYFDAIDGSYARYHHIASAYGDILDHGRDWVCTFVLFAVIIKYYKWRMFDTFFWIISLFMMGLFMGAQEQWVHMMSNKDVSLMLKPISWAFEATGLDPAWQLKTWLRWFGAGDINAAIALYLIWLPHRKR